MHIIVNTDFESSILTKELITFLEKYGHQVTDISTRKYFDTNNSMEGIKTAEKLQTDQADLGIIISSVPCIVSISANKVKNVRSINISDEILASKSKKEINPNVLAFPIMPINDIIRILEVFLNTKHDSDKYNHEVSTLSDYECSCTEC